MPVLKSSREWEWILVSEIAIRFFACLFQPELRERLLRKNRTCIHSHGDLSRKATKKIVAKLFAKVF